MECGYFERLATPLFALVCYPAFMFEAFNFSKFLKFGQRTALQIALKNAANLFSFNRINNQFFVFNIVT
nr:MAG TPA: hypothetical protein [Caudoviricetes sp.]